MDLARTTRTVESGPRCSSWRRSALPAPRPPRGRRARRRPLRSPAMRSWSAPASTRVVFDFSRPVQPVMPDSGRRLARRGRRCPRPASCPRAGVPVGARRCATAPWTRSRPTSTPMACASRILLAPGASFHAFTLAAEDGQAVPHRRGRPAHRRGGRARSGAWPTSPRRKKRDRVRLVYIDAGHGGEDAGARGPGPRATRRTSRWRSRTRPRRGAEQGPRRARACSRATRTTSSRSTSATRSPSSRRPTCSSASTATPAAAAAAAAAPRSTSSRSRAPATRRTRTSRTSRTPPTWWAACRRRPRTTSSSVLYNVKRNAALEHSQLLAETLLDHVAADRRVESRGHQAGGLRGAQVGRVPERAGGDRVHQQPARGAAAARPRRSSATGQPVGERRGRLLRGGGHQAGAAAPSAAGCASGSRESVLSAARGPPGRSSGGRSPSASAGGSRVTPTS